MSDKPFDAEACDIGLRSLCNKRFVGQEIAIQNAPWIYTKVRLNVSSAKGLITRCVFRGVFALRQTVCCRGMRHWSTKIGLAYFEKVTLMSDRSSYIKDATENALCNQSLTIKMSPSIQSIQIVLEIMS
jgi:hypothetical protein